MSYKRVICTGAIESISDAISALTDLGEECREIVDNAEGGLKETSRIQTFEETASALEGLHEAEVPECISELSIEYSEQVPRRKARHPSRAVRCQNAIAVLQAATEAAQQWLDDTDCQPEDMSSEKEEQRDEVQNFIDELDNIIGDAESCEFPGMFG